MKKGGKMDKNFRTLVFVCTMAAIIGLMFTTPFGIIWGVIVFSLLAILEATILGPVNLFLWAIFCYLLTVIFFWILLLKKAPQLQPAKSLN